ncbi:MAG: hypothetical protein GEU80_07815 [Dehalococcoidia bacterium]|nr:hypothetical protein [Dehalococcoidia bacterium]
MTDPGASSPRMCGQRVFADDDCCTEGPCTDVAEWIHPETGLALCALHESNARRYGDGVEWLVGPTKVSFPAGWERLDVPEPVPDTTLEVVREGAGLVTWDGRSPG